MVSGGTGVTGSSSGAVFERSTWTIAQASGATEFLRGLMPAWAAVALGEGPTGSGYGWTGLRWATYVRGRRQQEIRAPGPTESCSDIMVPKQQPDATCPGEYRHPRASIPTSTHRLPAGPGAALRAGRLSNVPRDIPQSVPVLRCMPSIHLHVSVDNLRACVSPQKPATWPAARQPTATQRQESAQAFSGRRCVINLFFLKRLSQKSIQHRHTNFVGLPRNLARPTSTWAGSEAGKLLVGKDKKLLLRFPGLARSTQGGGLVLELYRNTHGSLSYAVNVRVRLQCNGGNQEDPSMYSFL